MTRNWEETILEQREKGRKRQEICFSCSFWNLSRIDLICLENVTCLEITLKMVTFEFALRVFRITVGSKGVHFI